MIEQEKQNGPQLSAVLRTFRILETLAEKEHMSLERLAGETGLAKPTLLRFLSTLREMGYVYRDENDQYFCTLKLFSVGSKAMEHMSLPRIAQPVAQALSKELKETVHVGIRQEDEVVYVIKVESKYNIRIHSYIGKRIPLYCTALGKIMLSDDSNENIDRYIKNTPLIPYSQSTITNSDGLKSEIQQVIREGFAHDRGEHDGDSRCIAAPIRDYSGRVAAAISVSWPGFRFDASKEPDFKAMIARAAGEISACLGYNTAKAKTI